MIKRTICFSNPALLTLANGQLVVKLLDPSSYNRQAGTRHEPVTTLPIEDIGVVVFDHPQITLSHGLLGALVENNTALITCDRRHLPAGLLLPLEGHTLQSERYRDQIEASLPLKKQLWQQTVSQKIRNQAAVLSALRGEEVGNMLAWSRDVRSGDSENLEGRAAAFYWSRLFPDRPGWTRGQEGEWPNALLNYGYAVVRALVARALVSSGLLPTLGIHHHNRYNAYCLADDIMEPYRPYVDKLVVDMLNRWPSETEITTDIKIPLLGLPVVDVVIGGQRSPLMLAVTQTTASLCRCFGGESRKISYPEIALP